MISRSLGPEFGGAIGIIFALANAVAVSLHTVGFCEALNDLLVQQGIKIVDNGENDIRIIGSATLIVLACIVSIGMEWEAKAQLLLMGILVVSLGNFLVGSFMGPTSDDEIAKGFVGFDGNFIQILQTANTQLFETHRSGSSHQSAVRLSNIRRDPAELFLRLRHFLPGRHGHLGRCQHFRRLEGISV